MDSEKQRAAQDAVLGGLLAVDKRQGFRGPVMHARRRRSERKAFIDRSKKAMGEREIENNRLYVGAGDRHRRGRPGATCRSAPHKGVLPLLGMRWARKVNPEALLPGRDAHLGRRRSLKPGDVIVVRAVEQKDLTDDREQYDSEARRSASRRACSSSGWSRSRSCRARWSPSTPTASTWSAMVGGYDFDANEYNRAFQACRQPGSTFKPLVYSAALEKLDWTEATRHRRQPHRRERPGAPGALEAGELHRGVPRATCCCAPRSSTR